APARAGEQDVVAGAAEEGVVAGTAEDLVVAGAAVHGHPERDAVGREEVVAAVHVDDQALGVEEVDRPSPGRGGGVKALEDVAVAALVGEPSLGCASAVAPGGAAAAAPVERFGVAPGSPPPPVSPAPPYPLAPPRPAGEHVVAGAAGERVVAGAAEQVGG